MHKLGKPSKEKFASVWNFSKGQGREAMSKSKLFKQLFFSFHVWLDGLLDHWLDQLDHLLDRLDHQLDQLDQQLDL